MYITERTCFAWDLPEIGKRDLLEGGEGKATVRTARLKKKQKTEIHHSPHRQTSS